MAKVFEDEFSELQTGLIALCMELTGGNVEKIYIYCSNEKKSKMFNAFFEQSGKIKTLNQMGVEKKVAFQFLRLGMDDLKQLDEICQRHQRPTPTELKICYDVISNKCNAQYQYEEICSENTDKSAGEVFMEWLAEVRG